MNPSADSVRIHAIAAALALALALSACGGDDDAGTAAAPPVTETFAAALTGDQEAPVRIDTTARGAASFTLDRASGTLSGRVVTNGVIPVVAHIHIGTFGVAGPVSLRLSIDAATGEISLPATVLTQAQLDDLAAGALYVNVHSEAHPAGEIRGQIARAAGTAQAGRTGTTAGAIGAISSGPGAGAAPDDVCTAQVPPAQRKS